MEGWMECATPRPRRPSSRRATRGHNSHETIGRPSRALPHPQGNESSSRRVVTPHLTPHTTPHHTASHHAISRTRGWASTPPEPNPPTYTIARPARARLLLLLLPRPTAPNGPNDDHGMDDDRQGHARGRRRGPGARRDRLPGLGHRPHGGERGRSSSTSEREMACVAHSDGETHVVWPYVKHCS